MDKTRLQERTQFITPPPSYNKILRAWGVKLAVLILPVMIMSCGIKYDNLLNPGGSENQQQSHPARPADQSKEIPTAEPESEKGASADKTKETLEADSGKGTSPEKPKEIPPVEIHSGTPLSPYGKHEARYQSIFKNLVKQGMKQDRIIEIFSSERAKVADRTPINRMKKRVTSKARVRSKKQVVSVAKQINKHLNKYKKTYDILESKYNLNREIAAAILYKETSLGRFKNWKHNAFTVLNSIVGLMELPDENEERRHKRAKRIVSTAQRSLEGLLLYCDKYEIDVLKKNFPSSFAGAIGFPQFLPMYMEYVITNDGKMPNLNNMHHAILSMGNLFNQRFEWGKMMDLDKLEAIDRIKEHYKIYDEQKNVTFCMREHLDGYPLKPFVDVYTHIPHIDYIGKFAPSIMHYNFSSAYTLDVLQYAYHANRIRTGKR